MLDPNVCGSYIEPMHGASKIVYKGVFFGVFFPATLHDSLNRIGKEFGFE